MPVDLTTNAIAAILNGDVDRKPLVQVLEIKLIGNQDRYRILISDGVASHQAVLATQLNDLIKTGRLQEGSVVQLIDYICSNVQNKKIVLILNMVTITVEYEIIGTPQLPEGFNVVLQKASSQNNLEKSNGCSNKRLFSQLVSSRASSGSPSSSTKNMQSFCPTVQPPYQPPPSYKSHGPVSKNEAPARIVPISILNPYQGRWAIKARVTAKGDLRRYNNAKGDGKVFSFDLLDSEGGEIRVTCFNSTVDRFYDVVEQGKIYLISKGSLKPAKKTFNHLKNEWEILLDTSSIVEPCPGEDKSIPQVQFSFSPISEIENVVNNAIVDIIGIVISVNPSVTILRKNGMETQRRVLNLKDTSGRSIEITLWGDFCNKEGRELQGMLDSGSFPVLAVKAGKVNDFSGKSVGTISSSQLFINPDLSEATHLREWFDHGGKESTSRSISKDVLLSGSQNETRKTVSQIKDEGLGRGDKPDWITVKATVSFVKTENFCYTACPLIIGDRQCGKKVTRSSLSSWHCERCGQEFEECDYRYLLQIQIQDHTGLTWVTAFQESGEELFGVTAKELYFLKHEEQNNARFGEIIKGSLFNQYLFTLKIKEEIYGDEQRVRITIVKAEKVNFSLEGRFLLDLLTNAP